MERNSTKKDYHRQLLRNERKIRLDRDLMLVMGHSARLDDHFDTGHLLDLQEKEHVLTINREYTIRGCKHHCFTAP